MQEVELFRQDDWAISQIIAGWMDVRLHYTDSTHSIYFDCEPCFEKECSGIRGLSVFTHNVFSSITDRSPVSVSRDVLNQMKQRIKFGLESVGYWAYNLDSETVSNPPIDVSAHAPVAKSEVHFSLPVTVVAQIPFGSSPVNGIVPIIDHRIGTSSYTCLPVAFNEKSALGLFRRLNASRPADPFNMITIPTCSQFRTVLQGIAGRFPDALVSIGIPMTLRDIQFKTVPIGVAIASIDGIEMQ